MKLTSVKKASEVVLDGVKVEMTSIDGDMKNIRFEDASGHVVVVSIDTYSMKVSVPAPKETVKKYRLHGSIGELGSIDLTFERRAEASAKRDAIRDAMQNPDDEMLAIDEVTVEVEP